MPPKRVTLRYYATLPVAEEPEYADGYHCDYCGQYYNQGPLYHCPTTGTDGCISCVESRGQKQPGASTSVGASSQGPQGISLIAFPTPELYNTARDSLQKIADNFRATSNSNTNSLFLAATERSMLVLGYMMHANVMGALLSTGASVLVITDGVGGLGPACLAVPGNDVILRGAATCSKALQLGKDEGAMKGSPSQGFNTIVPIMPEQLRPLFPWIDQLRAQMVTCPSRTWSAQHHPAPSFILSPGAWPPFLQSCSAVTPAAAAGPECAYFTAVTSDGLIQCISFAASHDLQWNTNESVVRCWGTDGEAQWNNHETLATRLWIRRFLEGILIKN